MAILQYKSGKHLMADGFADYASISKKGSLYLPNKTQDRIGIRRDRPTFATLSFDDGMGWIYLKISDKAEFGALKFAFGKAGGATLQIKGAIAFFGLSMPPRRITVESPIWEPNMGLLRIPYPQLLCPEKK